MTTSDTKETTHQQPSLLVDHLLAWHDDSLQEVQRTTFASLHLHLVTIANAICHIDAARGKAKLDRGNTLHQNIVQQLSVGSVSMTLLQLVGVVVRES